MPAERHLAHELGRRERFVAAGEHRRPVSLLDLDEDLGSGLPAEAVGQARAALTVAVRRLRVGVWNVSSPSTLRNAHIGVLIVDGLVACDVLLEDHISTELLGAGDVVRPWGGDSAARLLRHAVRWSVLAETRIALLDRRLAIALARFPDVHAALLDRVDRRAQRLAVAKAIAQLHHVDRRLLALFWHLAERWGRVTSAGVAIPLRLSHRMLADLIGARRPTVSSALGVLARRGELTRCADGSWLLTGEPAGATTPELRRFVPLRRRLVAPQDQ